MSIYNAVRLINTAGAAQGVLIEDGAISMRSYGESIAEGDVTGHASFSKIGFTPAMTTTDSDVWSGAGLYVFPTAATPMAVIGGANDDGTPALYSGTATGGSTTSLIDTGKNFTTPTSVVAGDCIVLEAAGTTPEWGYVTSLTSTNQLNVSGGFSSGGTGSGRTYSVIRKALSTGAQAVKIDYLDAAYASKTEIVITNGAAEVNLVASPFRINSFRIIATGTGNAAAAAIVLKAQTPTATVYGNITAGFTRARSSFYTVAASKNLFITDINGGFGETAKAAVTDYARMFLRINREPTTNFLTDKLFYPLTEVITFGATVPIHFTVPFKIPAWTDIKVSGYASTAGVAVVTYRGWLE